MGTAGVRSLRAGVRAVAGRDGRCLSPRLSRQLCELLLLPSRKAGAWEKAEARRACQGDGGWPLTPIPLRKHRSGEGEEGWEMGW